MAKRDYYDVLGIERGAADDKIKSAYRRLARKYHPDLNPGDPEAERRFKELGEAYEVLSDPQKRQVYDQFGREGVRAGVAAGAGPSGFRYTWTGEGSPFEDVAFEAFAGSAGEGASFIEELFGWLGGFRRGGTAGRTAARSTRAGFERAARRGQDVRSELALTLEQAIRGVRTSLALERPQPDGSARTERIEVTVPPGVRDGQRLRLRGRGAPSPAGGPAGDLYLTIHVRPHPHFRREGKDIYMDVPITVSEAALGATVEVPTVHGARTSVRVPPGTRGGQRLRLKGQGVRGPGAAEPGDQYCIIRIVTPRDLDDPTRALFEQLRGREPNPRTGAPWTD